MKRFEIQGVIGMGAYGVVLKATDKKTKEVVAIKKFKENDLNPIIKKICTRELNILKKLDHPNIIKLKEAFKKYFY